MKRDLFAICCTLALLLLTACSDDIGLPAGGGAMDAQAPRDASSNADGSMAVDSASLDASTALDASLTDAGATDVSTTDASTTDASTTDASATDASATDAGVDGSNGGPCGAGSVCSPVTLTSGGSTPALGGLNGNAGTPSSYACPTGQALVGLQAGYGGWIDGVRSICAPLMVSGATIRVGASTTGPLLGADHTNQGTTMCPSDQVVVGFVSVAGWGIDTLAVRCAPLNVSGRTITPGTASTAQQLNAKPAPATTAECPSGQIATITDVTRWDAFNKLALRCATPSVPCTGSACTPVTLTSGGSTPALGDLDGNVGALSSYACPTGQALVGLQAGYGGWIDGVRPLCAPLTVNGATVHVEPPTTGPLLGAEHIHQGTTMCPSNQAVVGFVSVAERGIDTLAVRCAPLNVSGTTITPGTVSTAPQLNTKPAPATTAECPSGQIATITEVTRWNAYNKLALRCATPSVACTGSICSPVTLTSGGSTPALGNLDGNAGALSSYACPRGHALVGLHAGYGGGIDGVRSICAPLTVLGATVRVDASTTGPLLGTENTNQGTTMCPSDQVVVGFVGVAEWGIDTLAVRCAPLNVSGTTITPGMVSTAPQLNTKPAPATTAECASGQVATITDVTRWGAYNKLALRCATPSVPCTGSACSPVTLTSGGSTPALGDLDGNAGTLSSYACPAGQALVGLQAGFGGWIDGVRSLCAPLTVSGATVRVGASTTGPLLGADHTNQGTTMCPSDQVVVGFVSAAGWGIDTLAVRCAPFDVSGTTITPGMVSTAPQLNTKPAPATTAECPSGQIATITDVARWDAFNKLALRCATPSAP